MTVNLFGRSSSFERSLARIAAAFGADAVWAFKPTREGNTDVLAATHAEPARSATRLPTRARKHRDSLGPAGAANGCGCSNHWLTASPIERHEPASRQVRTARAATDAASSTGARCSNGCAKTA